jgi:hypothetical protein
MPFDLTTIYGKEKSEGSPDGAEGEAEASQLINAISLRFNKGLHEYR